MASGTTNSTAASSTRQRIPAWQWIIIVFAGICLFLAQSSYWIRHTVFDQATFTSIASSTLQDDQNRTIIASAITDAALQDYPRIKNAVSDRVTPLISGVLASDIGVKVQNGLIQRTYAYLLAPNREDIAIDLTSIKQIATRLATLADTTGNEVNIDPSKIPDEIVLVQTEDVPDLSGVSRMFIWLAPLFWLLTIGLFTWFVALGGRAGYARRVYAMYAAIVIVGCVGLATGPFVPPMIASLITNIHIQQLADSLTMAFLAPFIVQMWWMLGVSTVVVAFFWQRMRLLHGTQAVIAKVSRKE